jgi:hypothetical protein
VLFDTTIAFVQSKIAIKNNKYPVVMGRKIFHPIFINWSYRYRGNAARTSINKKQNIVSFILKIISGLIQLKHIRPGNQPPKNKIVIKVDINSILLYSPKKNIAKIIEEYSTLYPATNSASASGKSKGARFVSASIDIKKITAQGNNGKKNHPVML